MIYLKISEFLKKSGKSYRELSKETGLSYVTISRLANAQTQTDYDFGISVLDKICSFFGKQPAELLSFKKK